MARLQEHDVVSKRKRGKTVHYDLNLEGLREIVLNQKRKEELEKTKKALKNRRQRIRRR